MELYTPPQTSCGWEVRKWQVIFQRPLSFDQGYTVRGQVASISRYSDLTGTTLIGSTSFTYDAVGQMTHEQQKNGSGTNIQNTTLTYDLGQRLTQTQIDGTTTTYAYDATNQLTAVGTTTYGSDANGNQNTGTDTTGTGNQTTFDGTWTCTYDNNGNMVKRSKGASAETWTYGYDNNNELIWVQQRATDGGTLEQQVTYSYDALGQRIQRTVTISGVLVETDHFGLDRGNVWVVMDGSNNFGSRRIFGPATDQIVARVTVGGAVAWYLTDYENSVTVMVDGSGTVQDRVTYDGFGNIVTETAPTFGDGYKYTGREWDALSQLQYNRARYYDPAIGKWIGRDPKGFAAGDANLYRYVGNGTTTRVDPNGEEWWLGKNLGRPKPVTGPGTRPNPVSYPGDPKRNPGIPSTLPNTPGGTQMGVGGSGVQGGGKQKPPKIGIWWGIWWSF